MTLLTHYVKLKFIFFVSLVFLVGCHHPTPFSQNSPDKEKVIKAYQLVRNYHSETEPANYVVKVVYFHGNDQAPLANWEERLTRVLDDISDFYGEEFHKYGIDIKGVPFEKNNGKYVFHVVQGDLSARSYNIQSGLVIQREISQKAAGRIDFSKDHVLIINGLCYKRDDGIYVFHSPYHGMGSFINGVCHAADCELLDSKLLKDTVQRMKFSEMMVELKECGVAEFNSWYIGGIAHEMGHIFSLPHDYGHPGEIDDTHISLTGQYGSRHFRDYLWKGKPSSVFTTAGILQLISHPVFSQFDKSRGYNLDFGLSEIQFDKDETGVLLKTKLRTKDSPYGIVALMRPVNVSEYFNRSFSNIIQETDSVNLELGKLAAGNYFLQVFFLFPSGASRWFNDIMVYVDGDGNAEMLHTSAKSSVNIQKLYEKLEKQEKTLEIQTKLEILNGILKPATPIDPATCQDKKLYLSDAKWEKAVVGWEQPARNYFTCEAEYKFFLELQGKLYSKGLYAHSPSSYVFNLDKNWKTFSVVIGLRDYAHSQGSAKFTIIGDGKVLYQSKALWESQQETINMNITNIKTLELKADGTEGHNHNSWAIWVNPVVEK